MIQFPFLEGFEGLSPRTAGSKQIDVLPER
jgi:hypothetical protein